MNEYIHVYKYIYVYMYIYIYTYTCIYMYMYINIQTYIHINTHIYIHTFIYRVNPHRVSPLALPFRFVQTSRTVSTAWPRQAPARINPEYILLYMLSSFYFFCADVEGSPNVTAEYICIYIYIYTHMYLKAEYEKKCIPLLYAPSQDKRSPHYILLSSFLFFFRAHVMATPCSIYRGGPVNPIYIYMYIYIYIYIYICIHIYIYTYININIYTYIYVYIYIYICVYIYMYAICIYV